MQRETLPLERALDPVVEQGYSGLCSDSSCLLILTLEAASATSVEADLDCVPDPGFILAQPWLLQVLGEEVKQQI